MILSSVLRAKLYIYIEWGEFGYENSERTACARKKRNNLEGEQQHEGHHKAEETHGFGQGEAENGVGEELLLEAWVARIADDQAAEDCADTGSGTSDSDGGSTSTDVLGGRIDIAADSASLDRRNLQLKHKQKFKNLFNPHFKQIY